MSGQESEHDEEEEEEENEEEEQISDDWYDWEPDENPAHYSNFQLNDANFQSDPDETSDGWRRVDPTYDEGEEYDLEESFGDDWEDPPQESTEEEEEETRDDFINRIHYGRAIGDLLEVIITVVIFIASLRGVRIVTN